MFGQKDAIILFEADKESDAADFTMQFGEVAEVCTELAQPLDELRWTH